MRGGDAIKHGYICVFCTVLLDIICKIYLAILTTSATVLNQWQGYVVRCLYQ